MMDPNIGYTSKSAIDKQVANPFYQYLTPDKYPGPNRNQKTVALKTLLVKYPQYGNEFDVRPGVASVGRYERKTAGIQSPHPVLINAGAQRISFILSLCASAF